MLVQYMRDRHRNPVGVMVSIKSEKLNTPLIGLSFCHSKKDKFNKALGRKIAIARVQEMKRLAEEGTFYWFGVNPRIPDNEHNLLYQVSLFLNRSEAYFKTDPFMALI